MGGDVDRAHLTKGRDFSLLGNSASVTYPWHPWTAELKGTCFRQGCWSFSNREKCKWKEECVDLSSSSVQDSLEEETAGKQMSINILFDPAWRKQLFDFMVREVEMTPYL